MKSLKELVDNYGGWLNDEQIILKYYVDNEMEDKAIEMLVMISQEKIKKVTRTLGFIHEWSPIITMNFDNIVTLFGKENAFWVMQIQLWFINHMEEWSDELNTYVPSEKSVGDGVLIRGLMAKIQEIELPKNAFFFKTCLDWLHSKGIYFKNEVKE